MPKSYDEITRKTVPEPDSSFRPTSDQLEQTRKGVVARSPAEEQLLVRVKGALVAGGLAIDVDVDGDTITLRGSVRTPEALARATELASQVSGVSNVVDQLVIAPAPK